MKPDNLVDLALAWRRAKQQEAADIAWRRELEDAMLSMIGLPESLEGTETAEAGALEIKVTGRLNRKIDAEKLQDIALEHGLSDHLPVLFRWKPELNMTLWRHADDSITQPLLAAITTTPGRPSFSITDKE